MTTIKDIAEYTGVSATTVSNVIHGKKNRVSPQTVQKIQDAIKELNYVPNMFARSLVSSSSKVVAMIDHLPTRTDANFSDSTLQLEVLSTLESILRENGYYLMFRRVETAEELTSFLANWNVDGLFVGGVIDEAFYEELEKTSTPKVYFDCYECNDDVCNIAINDSDAVENAIQYLIDNGHKRIAFASQPLHDGYVMKERFKGYKSALAKNNINFDSHLVFESEVGLDACRLAAKEIINTPGITAVMATTDLMAAGLMTAFRENGIRIPEDISIIGFDNFSISQMTVPPLTTLNHDMKIKSRLAGENMIKMLNGEKAEGRVECKADLIIRESVAKLN